MEVIRLILIRLISIVSLTGMRHISSIPLDYTSLNNKNYTGITKFQFVSYENLSNIATEVSQFTRI